MQIDQTAGKETHPLIYVPEPVLIFIAQGYHASSPERVVELLLLELRIRVADS